MAGGWRHERAKTAVITGGGGFVIANVVRLWLERDASARAIVIDASPLDAAAKRHFAPFADRLQFVIGDVGKPETWAACRRTPDMSCMAPPSRPCAISTPRAGRAIPSARIRCG
jgi:dTDP-D-glucose 4,6-dehydratase